MLTALWTALMGSASAEVFVKPGDVNFIEFPIEHLLDSAADIENLELSIVGPTDFIVQATSIKGPVTLSPGQSKTFRIDYEIAAGAPEGPFNVELSFTATTEDVDPKLDDLDTSVDFPIGRGPFSVEA